MDHIFTLTGVKKYHPLPKMGGNSQQIGQQLSDRKLACHPILSDDLISKLHVL